MRMAPKKRIHVAVYVWFGLQLSLPSGGCGQNDRLPVYPVKGAVFFKKKPLAKGWVVFHPLAGQGKKVVKPIAQVAADGSFQLRTYLPDDGAPEGEYVVTITWPALPPKNDPDLDEGPDRLQNRFNDPKTSKWRFQIKKGFNDLTPLHLD